MTERGGLMQKLRYQLREVRELGARGTAFRTRWEIETRAGLRGRGPLAPLPLEVDDAWTRRLPFADPATVADAMRDRMPTASLEALRTLASEAAQGKVLCFGDVTCDFGVPIDWQLNPRTGTRWNRQRFWSQATADDGRMGDVKLTWEVARFPHAYHMARAAAFFPEDAPVLRRALLAQLENFSEQNPPLLGVHWASAQEVAIRSLAWVFSLDTLLSRDRESGPRAARVVADALFLGAQHISGLIEYARKAVYNNHLLAESLGLYLAGVLLPAVPNASRWRLDGRSTLDAQSAKQFYGDGGYILLSLNYHRAALQLYLSACSVAQASGDAPSHDWLSAMDRSLEFLLAHQNPSDGRMPNTGPNDGSLPSPLSTCDILDFRPTLQAVAAIVRGERIYDAGPWDEEMAWRLGARALDLPLRMPTRRSRSFPIAGFHVLRSKNDEGTFSTFRCGTLPDRFGQIDMLHVDIWWRGHNVAVDGGTFLYNGPEALHRHFTGTASHNTLMVDGRDQMVHYRRFKYLYGTEAKLLRFDDVDGTQIAEGEHYGFQRHPGGCVHRRQVKLSENGSIVVDDRVLGDGDHMVRLQWLLGEFPWRQDHDLARITLETPAGPWTLEVRNEHGSVCKGTVVAGQDEPPRGWISRRYGTKVPTPSLVVEVAATNTTLLRTEAGGSGQF